MPSFLGDLYSALCGQELYIIHGLFRKRLAAIDVLPSVVPNWIQRMIHRLGVTVVIFLSGRAGQPSMPSFLGDLYSAMCGQELYIIHGLFGKRLSSFSPVGRPPMHSMEAKAAGSGGQR